MRLLLSGFLAFSLIVGASSVFASTKKSGGSHASASRSHNTSSSRRSTTGKTRAHRSTTGSHRSGGTHRSKNNNPASNVPTNPN